MDETIGRSVGWGWGIELSRPSWRFGLLQHGLEGLLPVLAVEVQGGSGGGAVQEGIGRPFSGRRIVRCGDRLHLGGRVDEPQVSTDLGNGYCHVVPAGGAGITPVHNRWQVAVTSALKGLPAGLSEVEGCLLYTSDAADE